ncbi:GTP pyrophosphokinase [Rhizobium sp. BR 315]|uniref:GTP pyrophosphokinase n=1 Tax=Rhizobium sp. BR 315 TaxID=3040014 RepID=UPI003D33BBC4
MTREQEILDRWEAEKKIYLAWGRLVSQEIQSRLTDIVAPQPPEYFLRIPAVPRTKESQKLIEKAFYRNKDYTNPYDDITDKVGTRFVVLLGSEIRKVEQVLTSVEHWQHSKDRDFEEEQKGNPLKFDYAAVHYVVRPAVDLEYEDLLIPAGTPCEVQIKTILQHAYSELTHDTIYKPQIAATPIMQRDAAKAMALLEATNDYFEKVAKDVEVALSSVRHMTTDLSSVYRDALGIDPKPSVLEGLLLAAYEKTVGADYRSELDSLLAEKPFIAERIKDHIKRHNPIFSQPAVLLVYLSVWKSPRKAKTAWPLTQAEMEPLLNDLGESIH